MQSHKEDTSCGIDEEGQSHDELSEPGDGEENNEGNNENGVELGVLSTSKSGSSLV